LKNLPPFHAQTNEVEDRVRLAKGGPLPVDNFAALALFALVGAVGCPFRLPRNAAKQPQDEIEQEAGEHDNGCPHHESSQFRKRRYAFSHYHPPAAIST
jgi:hypothetical protein